VVVGGKQAVLVACSQLQVVQDNQVVVVAYIQVVVAYIQVVVVAYIQAVAGNQAVVGIQEVGSQSAEGRAQVVDKQALLMEVAGMALEEEGYNLVLVVLVVDTGVVVSKVLLVLLLIRVAVADMVEGFVGEYRLQGWCLFWETLPCFHGWCSDRVQGSLVVQNVLEEFLEQSGAAIHPSFQP